MSKCREIIDAFYYIQEQQYTHLSNKELIREVESLRLNSPLVDELVARLDEFEKPSNKKEETIDGKTDNDYRDACISWMEEFCGEGYNHDTIAKLKTIMNITKKDDRINATKDLEELDKRASNAIGSIKHDGVIQ